MRVCVLLCTRAWEWLGRPRTPGDERSHHVALLSVSGARCGFARVFTAARDAVPSAEPGVVRPAAAPDRALPARGRGESALATGFCF